MSAVIADGALVRRRGQPLTAEVDGETVMFDPARGAYFSLGTVGSRVWALLEAPHTMGDLCTRLRAEFDVDELACRHEVNAFVQQLLDADLVELDSDLAA
jgi:hypothetical protein